MLNKKSLESVAFVYCLNKDIIVFLSDSEVSIEALHWMQVKKYIFPKVHVLSRNWVSYNCLILRFFTSATKCMLRLLKLKIRIRGCYENNLKL